MNQPKTPSIIGHKPIIQYLEYGLKHGKIGQVVLFTGPQHIGKTKLAFWLIQRQLCAQNTACGTCKPCVSFQNSTHPDVFQLPDDTKQLSVEQVRALRTHMQRSPLSGSQIFGLIPAAERMNDQAANALLKELEEPKPHARFILTSHQPDRLLATIRSRCGTIRCQLVPTEELHDAFVNVGVDRTKARNVARFAEGRPGIAISFLKERPFQRMILKESKYLLDVLTHPTTTAKLQFAEHILAETDTHTAMTLVESVLRECLRKTAGDHTHEHGLFHEDAVDAAIRNTTPATWAKRLQAYQDARKDLATPSKHQSIFERLLLHV